MDKVDETPAKFIGYVTAQDLTEEQIITLRKTASANNPEWKELIKGITLCVRHENSFQIILNTKLFSQSLFDDLACNDLYYIEVFVNVITRHGKIVFKDNGVLELGHSSSIEGTDSLDATAIEMLVGENYGFTLIEHGSGLRIIPDSTIDHAKRPFQPEGTDFQERAFKQVGYVNLENAVFVEDSLCLELTFTWDISGYDGNLKISYNEIGNKVSATNIDRTSKTPYVINNEGQIIGFFDEDGFNDVANITDVGLALRRLYPDLTPAT